MRVTSEMFVSLIIRRCFSDGGAAVVEHKGASEAGAVYFRAVHRDRTQSLYVPAPQLFFESEEAKHDRLFEKRYSSVAEFEISEKLAQELSFDSDIWIVELEADNPETYFKTISVD